MTHSSAKPRYTRVRVTITAIDHGVYFNEVVHGRSKAEAVYVARSMAAQLYYNHGRNGHFVVVELDGVPYLRAPGVDAKDQFVTRAPLPGAPVHLDEQHAIVFLGPSSAAAVEALPRGATLVLDASDNPQTLTRHAACQCCGGPLRVPAGAPAHARVIAVELYGMLVCSDCNLTLGA